MDNVVKFDLNYYTLLQYPHHHQYPVDDDDFKYRSVFCIVYRVLLYAALFVIACT